MNINDTLTMQTQIGQRYGINNKAAIALQCKIYDKK